MKDWKKIFQPFKNQTIKPVVNDFDTKLVRKFQKKRLPSWRQFCYIKQFLSPLEKMIIIIATIIAISATVILLLYITPKHLKANPRFGGEYSEALIGQPKLINPIFSSANDIDEDIASLLYAKLFKMGKDQKVIPELASQLTISEDQKVYTIKLREDAFWTDGEKINADDVAYTLEMIQNPEVQSPLYSAFNGVVVEKIGPFELTLTLKEPFAPFISNLSLGIIPEHVFDQIAPANLKLAKENLQPKVTSGQWKFYKYDKNEGGIETYSLEKNNRYFGELPYIKKITFKFYQDFIPAVDDLKVRTFMGLAFIPKNLSEAYGGKNFITYRLRLPQYTALFFNKSANTIIKDKKIRQILTQAIDKNTVLKTALGENGEIIHGPILSGFIGYHEEIEKIEFNREEAAANLDPDWERIEPDEYFDIKKKALYKEEEKKLLDHPDFETSSSTLKEELEKKAEDNARLSMRPDQTYYRKNSKDEILSITITTADTPEYQTAAESIALMWRSIGVQTNIIITPGKSISRDVLKGRKYEVLLFSEIIGHDPDPFPFWHSSQTEYPGLNLSKYSDKDVDILLEKARSATSTEERGKIYQDFQDTLIKDYAAIFLYSPTYDYLIDKKVKGIEINQIFSPSDRFNLFNKWYLKIKWTKK